MKFEEYLDTLPKNVLSGEDVQLPEKTFRDIFKFAAIGKDDIFYHLGCHDEKGIEIANKEFNVKKAVGIDNNLEKIKNAENHTNEKKIDVKLIYQNIRGKQWQYTYTRYPLLITTTKSGLQVL